MKTNLNNLFQIHCPILGLVKAIVAGLALGLLSGIIMGLAACAFYARSSTGAVQGNRFLLCPYLSPYSSPNRPTLSVHAMPLPILCGVWLKQDIAEYLLYAEAKLGEMLSAHPQKKPITESSSKRTLGSISTLPPGIDKKASHIAQTLYKNQDKIAQVVPEAKLGEMLIATERAKGTRPSKIDGGHMELPPSQPPTYSELGITKREASESQQAAASSGLRRKNCLKREALIFARIIQLGQMSRLRLGINTVRTSAVRNARSIAGWRNGKNFHKILLFPLTKGW